MRPIRLAPGGLSPSEREHLFTWSPTVIALTLSAALPMHAAQATHHLADSAPVCRFAGPSRRTSHGPQQAQLARAGGVRPAISPPAPPPPRAYRPPPCARSSCGPAPWSHASARRPRPCAAPCPPVPNGRRNPTPGPRPRRGCGAKSTAPTTRRPKSNITSAQPGGRICDR